MTYLYHRLQDVRKMKKLLQSEVAQILNITTQQYQLYESGKREIPVHKLIELARYYNVSVDYLLDIADELQHPESSQTDTESDLIGGDS